MNKRRLIGPIVAALVALAVMVVPAFASPALFCNYLFTDSSHTSITLPASSPETQCTGSAFGGSGYFNMRLVITAACASSTLDYDTLRLNFNGDTTTGNYEWTDQIAASNAASAIGSSTSDVGLELGLMPCRKTGEDPHGVMGTNVEIFDFASNSLDKQLVSDWSSTHYFSGSRYEYVGHAGGLWRLGTGPTAITSVTIQPNASAFEQNSRIAIILE